MNDTIIGPKFVLKYWERKTRDAKPPVLQHAVFYNEDDLIKAIKTVRGNYFIFEVGKQFEQKSYFDNLFEQERIEEERKQYEILKQKFEGNGETN